MRITVFGASGKVGQLVVAELLRRGHSVKAFVHNHSPFEADDRLSVIKGDVHDVQAVAQAVEGSQAVVSALGSWGTASKDILSSAVENIIPAMHAHGIRRIISVTGADARFAGDELSLVHRISYKLINVLGSQVVRDGEAHLAKLDASGLDWTMIRSPIMTSQPTQTYKLIRTRPMPWHTVPRQAVAVAMADAINNTTHNRQAPYIVRG